MKQIETPYADLIRHAKNWLNRWENPMKLRKPELIETVEKFGVDTTQPGRKTKAAIIEIADGRAKMIVDDPGISAKSKHEIEECDRVWQRERAEKFIAKAHERVDSICEWFEEWTGKMTEDPIYHMGRSQQAFEQAGELYVARYINEVLENIKEEGEITDPLEIVAKIEEVATRDIIRRSRYIERSSSTTSNMLDRAKLAAWATLLERRSWYW